MPTKIISKKSSIAASVPIASDLAVGEIAVNTADKRQYTKHTDNSIRELGINPSSVSTGSISVGGVAITATPAEINKLDGFTGSVSDLNKVAAVTASAVELNLLDGVTATTAELNTLDGITATAATLNGLNGRVNSNDSDIASLGTRITSNDGDITTLQGRATDLETFEATAGTAYIKDVTVSSTDTTANRLTKVGDFGVGGISSTSLTNANFPVIGSFQSSGQLTESTAITANFPSTGVSGSTPVWWNIFTHGGANTRASQEATEVFAITGGALFNVPRKFIRNKQDNTWDDWVEVWHSGNLIKTTSETDTTAGSMLKVGDFGVGAHLFSSGGNIGIGTTAPSEKLTVNGNIRVTQDINILEGRSLKFNASSFITPENGVSGAEVSSVGSFTVKTGSSPLERMRISSVGNVGIGTTTPDSTFSVASTSGTLVSRFQGSVSTGCLIGIDQATLANWRFGQPAGQNAFAFYGFGGGSHPEFMRIDGVGNVGIGTSTGSDKLNVSQASGSTILSLRSQGTSGTFAVVFQNPNGIVGNITISGTTTSYNTSSDKRLKENIVDSQSASNDIDSVQVRQFDWKADNKHQEYGFIAQELKEVAPYAVHTPEDTDEMQSVDYSKLVPMMIKELQELRKRVLTLENK